MYEITYQEVEEKEEYETIIKPVIAKCFEEEHLMDTNIYVSITLTTPNYIKQLNREYRGIDKETDVLSFPMYEKDELETKIRTKDFTHEDVLGDMVISIEQVQKQAVEYGHSFKRELSYMVVHSFYHLMGYDHMEESDKRMMREKEDKILNGLNISRHEM